MNLAELNKAYDFTGKTIAITGGAGILGGEIACALVGCGANVAILDRDVALAEPLLKRLGPAAADHVKVVVADVLKPEVLAEAAKTVTDTFGRVDALINTAGGNKPEATTGPDRTLFDLSDDALRFVVELNLMGTILPSRTFGKLMADQGDGNILNISSMAALRPLTRVVGYSASKAAVTNFTQWLAVHLAQEYSANIRVNAVAPGFFLTEQNRFLMTDRATGELTPRAKTILAHTPMKRFGQPEDLLGAVMWLLSPLSSFVTGIVLPIDGGFSAFSGV
jgi:NAD(P)-dependent dehydrogenase (short-subunit alcohol dehydrogenase family)